MFDELHKLKSSRTKLYQVFVFDLTFVLFNGERKGVCEVDLQAKNRFDWNIDAK